MKNRREFLKHAVVGTALATCAHTSSNAAAITPAAEPSSGDGLIAIPRTDLRVSRLAFGAGAIHPDYDGLNVLKAVYDNGINFFDHADFYGEEPFGRVLQKSKGLRDKLVIQSKCGIVRRESGKLYVDSSRANIINAAEGSLKRLGVGHLDLLLLHWPDLLAQPEEIGSAFSALRKEGKVRYFGVSNYVPSQIDLLSKQLDVPIVTNQIYLSLENSYLIAGGVAAVGNATRHAYNYVGAAPTIDYCRMNGIRLQAWSPLRGELINPNSNSSKPIQDAHRVLKEIAAEKNVSPSALSLAWLLHHPASIVPIVSSSKLQHVAENAAAMKVQLTRSEWYSLLDATVGIKSRGPT
ncbi:aldo/keto reductase [Steroidobacter flavus]|uniref:Aldo/keto reductase n=1 Tax=Steroidobacter flavus TaxID=1842136 RepID=A0ABV8T3J3_9GAMM